ncbi:MAG: alpha/beta hydrolase [Woeseia sp.]|nr:alpha/beta hydrolase [Woeseia sp.]|tara:strand:+ start:541 stop:1467 length:927 start_codon:yes stop_codon:yes gene_type:complete
MASIRSRIVRELTHQYMKRQWIQTGSDAGQGRKSVAAARRDFERRMSLLPTARDVRLEREQIAGVDCEWHVPKGCDGSPLIYYLHGGGFVVGGPSTHRRLVSHIASEAKMRAIVPDYRLSPENPFPAALDDSLKVWRGLRSRGEDSMRMVIGGDSAGGNLSVGTILSLRDAGEELPKACFLMSPWLDLAGEGESYETRLTDDPWFRPEQMKAVAARYCGASELRKPLVSPVYADMAGFPSTLIQVGNDEILLSDSKRLADNIDTSGGHVELNIYPKMWHVFQYFIGQMPESREALSEISQFLSLQVAN